MAVELVHQFTTESVTLDLRSGDCFLLFYAGAEGEGNPSQPPDKYLHSDESSAAFETMHSPGQMDNQGWFDIYPLTCCVRIGNITPGAHSITITPPEGRALHRGFVIRGTNGNLTYQEVRFRPDLFLPTAEYRDFWPGNPSLNTFSTAFPVQMSFPGHTALQLTWLQAVIGPAAIPDNPLYAEIAFGSVPYGDPVIAYDPIAESTGWIRSGYHQALCIRPVTNESVMQAPAYAWDVTYNPQNEPYAIQIQCVYWLFLESEESGADESGIYGVTQAGAYVEAPQIDGADGHSAGKVTQTGAYVEANAADPDATGVTQTGAYVETEPADPHAAGMTLAGAYVETEPADPGAAGVTLAGVYIEATIDPAAGQAELRISQAFALVEARRGAKLRISQAFALVEARKTVSPPPVMPDSGDTGEPPPPYSQEPPTPFDRTWPPRPGEIRTVEPLPPPETGTTAPPPAPYRQEPPVPFDRTPLPRPGEIRTTDTQPYRQAPPVPFRPFRWFSRPAPVSDLAPLPERQAGQPATQPARPAGHFLDGVIANRSRAILVDALASRLDAQLAPVKGTAVGHNLAMVNSLPAQTTETAPVAGRTATYVNVGRAARAIYRPEIQPPAAQKVNRATDAEADTALPAASPTTQIHLIYPLLGSGTLASDLTISLDPAGYREQIAEVIDAILQDTVTIGFEQGIEPYTFHLYVVPGVIDAATLDGMAISDLLLIGSAQNQILRYNAEQGGWLPASEPFSFKGMHLNAGDPPTEPGGFRYNTLTYHLEVLVDTI